MARRRSDHAGTPRLASLWRYAVTALLGLPGRPAPVRGADRARRDLATSSYEQEVGAANQLQFGRAYWLPPFGRGNGLDALFWAPLAELPGHRVDAVLTALSEAGIPAWAAARSHGAEPPAAAPFHALWVASARLDDAQDVLMRALAA